MRLVCSAIQFRTVAEALATRRVDLAIAIDPDLPASIARQPLVASGFVCLFDPRHLRLGARPSERSYLAQQHVIVSYNADLRGLVEEAFGRERHVRCAVPSFHAIAAIVDGSELVATIPALFAPKILSLRPHLRTSVFPFAHEAKDFELVWPRALEGDPAHRFVRESIERVASTRAKPTGKRRRGLP